MSRFSRMNLVAATIAAVISLPLAASAPPKPAAASPTSRVPHAEPSDRVQEGYIASARAFRQQTARFQATIATLPATATGDALLRREVAKLRAAYKRMEYLVDYMHPGSSARLNPPPLDRSDMSTPDAVEILPPEGLQILLEVAHEDRPLANHRDHLTRIAARLADAGRELENVVSRPPVLDDRMLFEAMQAQVIRVMTMGVTGFDAPATELSLPESRLSLEVLKPVIALYTPALKARDPALAKRLTSALDKALAALPPRADFDTFDRLAFIRTAGNPLYAALIDGQHVLGIATFADLVPLRRPVSVTARNLFDPDFLDPYFYSLMPADRPNKAVADLGRRLFFDTRLSTGGTMSCATCHDPRRAFSDGLAKSPALTGGTLPRNSPGLVHAAYQGAQFWDMREETLEKQVLHVITGAEEFRNDFLVILRRLQDDPEYPALFQSAFGAPESVDPLQAKTLTKALANYIRTLGRWNSPFDRYARGETEFLDPAAKRGFNLFMGKALCATCHFPPAFNGVVPPRYLDTESEVLGVPKVFPVAQGQALRFDGDLGRGLLRLNPIFQRAFKTPTVRNAEVTGPYMHNGGMMTLEDVLNFYNAGGGIGLGLDVPNQTLPSDSLGLTQRDMDDIVAFMKSLTDTTGMGAQRP